MKTILVPVDFSDCSENAAHYAAEIASVSNARIILLHTYSLMGQLTDSSVSDIQLEEVEKINEKFLSIFDSKLQAEHRGVKTEIKTAIGFYVEEILLELEQENIDLIVMGTMENTRSKPGLTSNVLAVIKESKCPVLVIPANVKFKKPETIALACDFGSSLPKGVIEAFKDFARLFNAKVLVFDVLKKEELVTPEKVIVEESLAESINDLDYSVSFPTGDNVVSEINYFVNKNDVDILAMIPHKHNFISNLFRNNSTKQVALNTHIPLLAIHEGNNT